MFTSKKKKTLVAANRRIRKQQHSGHEGGAVRIRRRYSDAWREVLIAILNDEERGDFHPIALRVATPLLLALDRCSRSELKRFDDTRKKIRKLLSDLVEGGSDAQFGVPHELSELAHDIQRARIETNYTIANVNSLPVRPEVLAIGEEFTVGSYNCATVTTIEKGDAATRLLVLLAQVLDRGLLSNLRSCKQCKKLLIAKKSDRKFCYDSNCADAYHNALKTREGVWKTARQQRRLRKLTTSKA